jgi:hypothetical protein
MTRKSVVKKKAAIRKFNNGTQEWADRQERLYRAAEKEWETGIEKSKQRFNPFVAEKYLNGGMDVLEHFAGSVMLPSPGRLIGQIDDLNRLRRVIARHTERCLSLLCEVAKHGEQYAARTILDFSVDLRHVIQWIVQNRPDCLSEMKDQSLLSQLLAWAQAGEIARGSVLKLERQTKMRLTTPATRLVFDFMKEALTLRMQLMRASSFFNQSAKHGQMNLKSYLIDRCGFPPGQICYKDLPEFSPGTFAEWWNRALKPVLDEPETLRSVRFCDPPFFKILTTAASRGKSGSTKDSRIKDQLKKRCRAALTVC